MNANQKLYDEYRKSEHWKGLRSIVLWRDEYKCCSCSSPKRLQVHHKFYRSRWEDTEPDDLVTLCNRCHGKEHGFIQKPQSKKKHRHKPNKKKAAWKQWRNEQHEKKLTLKRNRVAALTYLFGNNPVELK